MIILRDTDEKEGRWDFDLNSYSDVQFEIVDEELLVGDYTTPRLRADRILAVEKKTIGELCGCVTGDRERFQEQVRQMSETLRVGYVVINGHWKNRRNDMQKTIIRTMISWTQRWPNVHWHFFEIDAGAEAFCFRILDLGERNLSEGKL